MSSNNTLDAANMMVMDEDSDITELTTCSIEVYAYTNHKLIIEFIKDINEIVISPYYKEWKIITRTNDVQVKELEKLLRDFMNSKENIDNKILNELKKKIQETFGWSDKYRIRQRPDFYNTNQKIDDNPYQRQFFTEQLPPCDKNFYETLQTKINNYIKIDINDENEKNLKLDELFGEIQNEINIIDKDNSANSCKNTIKFMVYKGLFNRPIDPVSRPTFFDEKLFDKLKFNKDSTDGPLRESYQSSFNIYQKLILRFLIAYTYINIFGLYSTNFTLDEQTREQIIKVLLMLDNLHDFGKERGGDIKDCMIVFILSEINKNNIFRTVYDEILSYDERYGTNFISFIKEFSGVDDNQNVDFNFSDTDNKHKYFFKCQPWEKVILTQLFKFIDKIQEVYFDPNTTIVKNFNLSQLRGYFPTKLEPQTNNSCLTNVAEDTKTTQMSITDTYTSYKKYKKSLFTSGFDGNKVTRPPVDIDNNSNLTAPSIYDDTNVIYSTIKEERRQGKPSYYTRTFDNKYGVGGENDKVCNKNGVECKYKRADRYKIGNHKSSVQDHVENSVNEIQKYLGDNKDNMPFCKDPDSEGKDPDSEGKDPDSEGKDVFNFFLTLKALGDYTQLLEARNKDYRFITSDMLQVSMGIIIGVKIMFVYDKKQGNKKIFKIFNCTGDIIPEPIITQPIKRKRREKTQAPYQTRSKKKRVG